MISISCFIFLLIALVLSLGDFGDFVDALSLPAIFFSIVFTHPFSSAHFFSIIDFNGYVMYMDFNSGSFMQDWQSNSECLLFSSELSLAHVCMLNFDKKSCLCLL